MIGDQAPHGPGAPREEGGVVAVPAFQTGGRVNETGLALVHEGEYIVPAPGSEAQIDPMAAAGAGAVAAYHFPIEVEVIGSLSDEHKRELADYVYGELDDALRGLGG